MFRSFKKGLISVICVVTILANNSVPALAAKNDSGSKPKVKATLTLTNPQTGEVHEWEVPASDIQIQSLTADSAINTVSEYSLSDSETVDTATVSVDVSSYLATAYPSQYKLKEDKITITTGLSYSYDASTSYVSLHSCFGSIVPTGVYYVSNRVTWYKNMGSGATGTFYPPDNTWSYPTDTLSGMYSTTVPPYSTAECYVYVAGMEPLYTIASVTCNLDLP